MGIVGEMGLSIILCKLFLRNAPEGALTLTADAGQFAPERKTRVAAAFGPSSTACGSRNTLAMSVN